MSTGAANLVDHVLPDVPIRQFVVTLKPTPLRFARWAAGRTLTASIAQAIVAVRARIRFTGKGFRGILARILLSSLSSQRTNP